MTVRINERLLEVREYAGEGYRPVVDFGAWRVALMRNAPDLAPGRIDKMQRHDETDEVFVLLAGRCILFLGDGRDHTGAVSAVNMEPFKVYNVKKGVWHTHVFDENALVLIVENVDTTAVNSPRVALGEEERGMIIETTASLWS